MKLSLLLLLLLVLSCFNTSNCIPHRLTSIFSFGNSFADTGNFDNLVPPTQRTASRLPYGVTFGYPTGRFSDGRLIIDFIAEAFGVPLLPPFFSTTKSFRRGANFAVAGATTLDIPFFQRRGLLLNTSTLNISLSYQLRWFEELKPSLCKTIQECRDYFSKSLFVLGEFGVNDLNFPVYAGKSLDEIRSYVPEVIKAIRRATERLIKQGAVNLLVPGIPPIGCFPFLLSTKGSAKKEDYDPRTGCLRKLNDLARYHNRLLKKALLQLQNKHKKRRLMYADYYGAVIGIAHSPEHFGFSNGALRACCGKDGPYNVNANATCGQPGSTACKDPSTYVSWDGIHFTQAAYHCIATDILEGPLGCLH
ncbi:GDSL esterase/lipase At5g45910-like isoform X1 [Typha latifolia]|uniref:GDSL esterase/lipase At5g45910-like isoform X1 n=1 Tax=Typha latifolia TaxID=4733 RepID=UPI003C2C639F